MKASAAMEEDGGEDEIKSREWDENAHERASDGRFGRVAGAPRKVAVQAVNGGEAPGGKPKRKQVSDVVIQAPFGATTYPLTNMEADRAGDHVLMQPKNSEHPNDPTRAHIESALEAVEKVITYPESVEDVQVYQTDGIRDMTGNTSDANGAYGRDKNGNLVIQVLLGGPSGSPHPRQTTVHEIGHHVDDQIFGQGGGFGSETAHDPNSPLHEWWNAVLASETQTLLADWSVDPQDKDNHPLYKYYLLPQELFARSFSQYVTHITGDPQLEKDINYIKSVPVAG